jgi:hypothetical protein
VVTSIVLRQPILPEQRKGTYFKMDSTLLKQPDFLQAALEAWGTNTKDQPAGEFWLSAMRRLTNLMKQERKTQQNQISSLVEKRARLANL